MKVEKVEDERITHIMFANWWTPVQPGSFAQDEECVQFRPLGRDALLTVSMAHVQAVLSLPEDES